MNRYVEFELPDGNTVVIESDEPKNGLVKIDHVPLEGESQVTGAVRTMRGVEVLERANETFERAAENARKAASVILDKLSKLGESANSPDEIEITFGLKASGELGNIVVAKASAEANYSVRMTWRKR